jgi:hypothetical protein
MREHLRAIRHFIGVENIQIYQGFRSNRLRDSQIGQDGCGKWRFAAIRQAAKIQTDTASLRSKASK